MNSGSSLLPVEVLDRLCATVAYRYTLHLDGCGVCMAGPKWEGRQPVLCDHALRLRRVLDQARIQAEKQARSAA